MPSAQRSFMPVDTSNVWLILALIMMPNHARLRMHPAMSSATISELGADMAIKLETILIWRCM